MIDNDPAKWIAGYYTVALELTENKGKPDEKVRSTNEFPFSIAPKISAKFPINAAAGPSATVTLRCTPKVLPEQRVAMLLGDREWFARDVQDRGLTIALHDPAGNGRQIPDTPAGGWR